MTKRKSLILISIVVILVVATALYFYFFQNQYLRSMNKQIDWLADLQTTNGAIKDSVGPARYDPVQYKITPYYANLAAEALTFDKKKLPVVKKYLEWYLSHLNWPDNVKYDGRDLYGTIYDYYVDTNGNETCSYDYDSADSYAATFLSLIRRYHEVSGDIQFIKENDLKLAEIGNIMITLMDDDNLTFAKPDYLIKYLMDNCEVYKGLDDISYIYEKVLMQPDKALYFKGFAEKLKSSLITAFYNSKEFYVYKDLQDFRNVNWDVWYPDSVSQLYPVLFGVISPIDSMSKFSYATFCEKWDWVNLNATNDYPWVLVGYVSEMMGSHTLSKTFYANINDTYLNNGVSDKWNSLESAWYINLSHSLGTSKIRQLKKAIY